MSNSSSQSLSLSSSSSSSSSLTTTMTKELIELNYEEEYRKNKSIFGQILRGEEVANFIYQDELCVAFNDIHPIGKFVFFSIKSLFKFEIYNSL